MALSIWSVHVTIESNISHLKCDLFSSREFAPVLAASLQPRLRRIGSMRSEMAPQMFPAAECGCCRRKTTRRCEGNASLHSGDLALACQMVCKYPRAKHECD